MGSRSNLDLVLSRFIFITALAMLIFFQRPVFAQSATQAFSLSGAHTLELTGEASLDVVPDELSFLIVIDHTPLKLCLRPIITSSSNWVKC